MTNTNEVWKVVPSLPELEASNFGNVRYVSNKKELKTYNNNGYRSVSIKSLGKSKSVHRLVMEAFFGENDMHVNHKNNDRGDNRLENLEYVTIRENNSYRWLTTDAHKKTSKHIGVCYLKYSKKWKAIITLNKRRVDLGVFLTEEEAIQAYKRAFEENGEKNKYLSKTEA